MTAVGKMLCYSNSVSLEHTVQTTILTSTSNLDCLPFSTCTSAFKISLGPIITKFGRFQKSLIHSPPVCMFAPQKWFVLFFYSDLCFQLHCEKTHCEAVQKVHIIHLASGNIAHFNYFTISIFFQSKNKKQKTLYMVINPAWRLCLLSSNVWHEMWHNIIKLHSSKGKIMNLGLIVGFIRFYFSIGRPKQSISGKIRINKALD